MEMEQVEIKLKQARLEAKMEADAQLLALRKRVLELEFARDERERRAERERERYEQLQRALEELADEHRRSLAGMRGDLSLERLLAALETEKAVREKLRERLEAQGRELGAAEQRAAKLDSQVTNYQKTETVLGEATRQFQLRLEAKQQQLAAATLQAEQDVERRVSDELAELRTSLEAARSEEKKARDELAALRLQHESLRERVESATKHEAGKDAQVEGLLAQISELETEKAVLQSKVTQLQKADAHLRSKANAQSEEIAKLQEQVRTLEDEKKELQSIAFAFEEMLERQNAERRQSLGPDDLNQLPEDEEFTQRKKRLRLSLG